MEIDFRYWAHSQGQLCFEFCSDFYWNVKLWSKCLLKGYSHQKKKNCHQLLSFVEGRYLEQCSSCSFSQLSLVPIHVHCMEKEQLAHYTKYLLFFSTQKINSYRFGTAWGWVNVHRILRFTIPLNRLFHHKRYILSSYLEPLNISCILYYNYPSN